MGLDVSVKEVRVAHYSCCDGFNFSHNIIVNFDMSKNYI